VLRTRRRRLTAIAAGVVVAVASFLVLTAYTGLPGPGPLRRYKASQLEEMVDAVHADAGDLRTPDDCWQTLRSDQPSGDRRPVATVDWVRSRVVIGMRSDNIGEVDPRTRREIERRIDAIVAAHPGLTTDMVVLEPSPEGWSPLMSCTLVVRGWGGF
jgi:hypothetical protein